MLMSRSSILLVLALTCWIVQQVSAQSTNGRGLSPDESIRAMKVASGFRVESVAAEPLVRQPVAMEFDDRGRLWVLQYLQYPNPADLKRVSVDRYSRTVYDRVPEPPPKGPKGADRLTILEDTDGDGRMDHAKDFVAGLNLASGFAFSHGGVFVIQVPYLLFYPDRDRDDLPDSDPEVLLSGFGMEDAHSVANSLTFGPDGWLYGCQGSTVTARVRGIEFQQGVWRYHPIDDTFELFCEGGGNAWGLDFDATGRLFYSTNYGGYTMVHGVQGAYYVKSFQKHGELHNPHAYGYFEHVPHQQFQGGHVTVGGLFYQARSYPEFYRGKYVAGDLLGHGVYWHRIEPRGSTVSSRHGGELLLSSDAWFAPTDLVLGPEGAIYVSDWNDARTAHPDPDADWDRSNGRIYRIVSDRPSASESKRVDFSKASYEELDRWLRSEDNYYVRRARQEIVRRANLRRSPQRQSHARDQGVPLEYQKELRKRGVESPREIEALEALWVLLSIKAIDEPFAEELLQSPHEAIRWWTIRSLGDRGPLSVDMAHRLDRLAEVEPSVAVRQQLACSAARWPPSQAMPIINANINRDIDGEDPYLPLLWWWAVEKHSIAGKQEVLARFVRPTLWKSKLGSEFLLPRLIQRYTAEGTSEGLEAVDRLIHSIPSDRSPEIYWASVLKGLLAASRTRRAAGNQQGTIDHPLADRIRAQWKRGERTATLRHLGVLWHIPEVMEEVRERAFSAETSAEERTRLFEILRSTNLESIGGEALSWVRRKEPVPLRVAAARLVLQQGNRDQLAALCDLCEIEPSSPFKIELLQLLLQKKETAHRLLSSIEQGKMTPSDISIDLIRKVDLLGDHELNRIVQKHWGKMSSSSREEKLAEVRRLNNDLRAAEGDPQTGKTLFKKHCGNCHSLFGEGEKIGPELTTANRHDRDFLLQSLVDPSSSIRKEYLTVVLQTNDGRVMSGMPIDRNDNSLTIVNSKGERTTIASNEVEVERDSPNSIMPEDLYRTFTPQELRDLFAYLQAKQP